MAATYDLNDYQAAMRRTYKPDRLMNHILGLVGEAGESKMPLGAMRKIAHIAEIIKKAVFHAKPYTRDGIKDELGDVLWYLTAMAEDHELTLNEIAQHNAAKLAARYPQGFVKGGGIR